MSKVLFLGIPTHGHVNPTLGLVSALIKQGEEVTYFCSEEFKEKIEITGAVYKGYIVDLNLFQGKQGDQPKDGKGSGLFGAMFKVLDSSHELIDDILYQTKDLKFDYMIHSAAFPFAKVMAQILNIPTVSSLAIFAGLKGFLDESKKPGQDHFKVAPEMMNMYKKTAQSIEETYSVKMPDNILNLLFNKGDINFVYTSEYFLPESERAYFDESFKFVGPPIYDRKENLDFPFEKLEGKKVIYISLGTIFGSYNLEIYDIFFKSFAGSEAVIVMAAHNVDLSPFDIPDNFIVRNYVPQSEVLKYTDVAITHAGMNSISDLIYHNIPFVALPMGADQPALAKRAEALGAAVSLDIKNLSPEVLRESVEKVLSDPGYLENLKKISDSFKEAGGYEKAVEEIFKLKKEKGICD